jgi:hypothetical protein
MSSQIVNKGIHQVFYNSSKAAASSIVKQLAVEVGPLFSSRQDKADGFSGLLKASESTPFAPVTSLPTRRRFHLSTIIDTYANIQRAHGPQAPRVAEEGPRPLGPIL